MNNSERFKRGFIYIVFICYTLLLIKILFLSRVSHLEHRSINLIPFHSMMAYISGRTTNLRTFAFGNVVGNIVIFIPLGFYLPLFKNDIRVWTNLLFVFAVSLFVEIIQGLSSIGTADIDDIILNCLGGLIGILGYKFLLVSLRGEKNVLTATVILSAIGLPLIILYYLFIVRMRF